MMKVLKLTYRVEVTLPSQNINSKAILKLILIVIKPLLGGIMIIIQENVVVTVQRGQKN